VCDGILTLPVARLCGFKEGTPHTLWHGQKQHDAACGSFRAVSRRGRPTHEQQHVILAITGETRAVFSLTDKGIAVSTAQEG